LFDIAHLEKEPRLVDPTIKANGMPLCDHRSASSLLHAIISAIVLPLAANALFRWVSDYAKAGGESYHLKFPSTTWPPASKPARSQTCRKNLMAAEIEHLQLFIAYTVLEPCVHYSIAKADRQTSTNGSPMNSLTEKPESELILSQCWLRR
jgi:hypothetical protein